MWWLSLASVVGRVLEQYDILYVFSQEESKSKVKESQVEAEQIFKILSSRFTILYFRLYANKI